MCLFFFSCRGIFGTSWVCRVALACLHGSSLLQLLTWLDHAPLWSLKNESRFYCKLYQNDFKTKQTTRACSIYSLLLTHLKEHKGSPSLPPSKANVENVLLKQPSLFTCEAKSWSGYLWKWARMLAFSTCKGHLVWLHHDVLAWVWVITCVKSSTVWSCIIGHNSLTLIFTYT